jgi:mutator family transposase
MRGRITTAEQGGVTPRSADAFSRRGVERSSEAETFWSVFLKSLARRGLRGVKLVISDAHEGLKAAIRRVFSAT